MGVDIETYRGRIGTFKFASGVDVIILQCTLNFSGCLKAVGSLVFIGILLLMAGIEQNPGPTEQDNSSAGNNSMVISSRKDLNQPPYKNWVRAATGFRYLKSGLQTFINRQLQEQHSDILRKIGPAAVRCTSCTTDDLLPDHPSRNCLQKFRNKCFCKDHHSRRKCPNNFCSKFYDEIIICHAEANPLWFNVDTTRWYDNFFEFAKCFVSTTGYREQHSVTEMDALGLLSIAINDLHIHDAIDKLDLFKMARESRHEIFHTKSYEVTDDQLNTYIEEMIDVLQDTKCLASYPDAQQAVEELKRLKANQIYISEEDASAVMDIALEAIRESKHEAISDIENARASAIHDIDSRQGGKQIDEETRLFKRQELRAHIIKHYERYYSTIDVSPFVRSKEIAIDELYAPLIILHENQKMNTFMSLIKTQQTFFNNGNLLGNVFLTGEAGFGKTTVCKKLLSVWCNLDKGNERNRNFLISTGQDWKLDFFQFLFYISLRDTNKESSLEEMVKKQLLPPKYHDTFEEILEHEPEKCLFICDGLDEWNPLEDMPKDPTSSPGLPLRNSKSNYVTLFTARSWKLDNVRPKSGEIDAILSIRGIVSPRELIGKLLRLLDKTSNKQFTIDRFMHDVEKRKKLQPLMKTPLVLKLIVCLWYDKQMLHESLTCVYSDIIELFLRHAAQRNNRDHDFQVDASNIYSCKANICSFISVGRPYIQKNSFLLLKLSKFAFETFFSKDKQTKLIFKTSDLSSYGITDSDLKFLLKLGILSFHMVAGTSVLEEEKEVAFINSTLFQKYFAACYITSKDDIRIETIFIGHHCNCIQDIRNMETFLVFVSYMNPSTMHRISAVVASIMNNGIRVRLDRQHYQPFIFRSSTEVSNILFTCLREAKYAHDTDVRIIVNDIIYPINENELK